MIPSPRSVCNWGANVFWLLLHFSRCHNYINICQTQRVCLRLHSCVSVYGFVYIYQTEKKLIQIGLIWNIIVLSVFLHFPWKLELIVIEVWCCAKTLRLHSTYSSVCPNLLYFMNLLDLHIISYCLHFYFFTIDQSHYARTFVPRASCYFRKNLPNMKVSGTVWNKMDLNNRTDIGHGQSRTNCMFIGVLLSSSGSALDHRSLLLCSNLGMGISEGCFIFDFTSLPLEVGLKILSTVFRHSLNLVVNQILVYLFGWITVFYLNVFLWWSNLNYFPSLFSEPWASLWNQGRWCWSSVDDMLAGKQLLSR